MKTKKWYSYLWIWSIVYFSLGFFNILFAWLGMIEFLLPLMLAIFGGNKAFCNNFCGSTACNFTCIMTAHSVRDN